MPSIPKISEPSEIFIDLISVVISDEELKVEISEMLVSFDEVILLEMRCVVDSMAADDLFCKLEIDALIFSKYS